jgi:hypothetical protein
MASFESASASTLPSPGLMRVLPADTVHADLARGVWNGLAFSGLLWAAGIVILV